MNATPLIDVVMCLVVFFLIVGKLAADRRAALELPRTGVGLNERSDELVIVNVAPGRDGGGTRIMCDAEEVRDTSELTGLLAARLSQRPGTAVQVRASRELAFGSVRPVLAACAAAGAGSVRLATERVP